MAHWSSLQCGHAALGQHTDTPCTGAGMPSLHKSVAAAPTNNDRSAATVLLVFVTRQKPYLREQEFRFMQLRTVVTVYSANPMSPLYDEDEMQPAYVRFSRSWRDESKEETKDQEVAAIEALDCRTHDKIRGLDFAGINAVPYDALAGRTDHVAYLKCTLTRSKKLWGAELALSIDDHAMLVAKRQRSGNYHIYDVSCGTVGSKHTKKSGNYIGKIAAASSSEPQQRVLLDNSADDRRELAVFVHNRTTAFSALVDGAKPRQLCVVLPGDSAGAKNNLMNRFLTGDPALVVLNQRQPKLVDGIYSLNFRGRATVASVKNCQLIVDGARGAPPALQLGKVGHDRYNLDYSSPFTPLLAFAFAASQFM